MAAFVLIALGVVTIIGAVITQILIVPAIVVGAAMAMMGVEWKCPGRNWPRVPGWWTRVIILNAFQGFIVVLAGLLWDKWMLEHRPWSADWMGPTWGAAFGYFILTFVYYWWHRWRHQFNFLWLWLHQIHHSPQRIEVITSFYKHPLELLTNGLIVSAVVYLLVGLNLEAATGAVLLAGLAELFYHWNVPTPHWIGYIIQRPESHCIHHMHNWHQCNYGDLPIWDMLGGTFHNPRKFDKTCGFGELEHQLGTMLLGKDVHAQSVKGGN